MQIEESKLLWQPGEEAMRSRMAQYMLWLEREKGLSFPDYASLWEWSVADIEAFWASIWDYFQFKAATSYKKVLSRREMPGAVWFEGVTLNYADQVLRHTESADAASRRAIVYTSEDGEVHEKTWAELRDEIASFAEALRGMGIKRGDRVVAIMPNIPQTIVTFLAVASIGAIWSLCSPDMGRLAIVDRFRQIEPKAFIAVDGYVYGGKSSTGPRRRARSLMNYRPSSTLSFYRRSKPKWTLPRFLAYRTGVNWRRRQPSFAPRFALRSPALGRLFLGHDRTAQAHCAWTWRHRCRGGFAALPAWRCRPR